MSKINIRKIETLDLPQLQIYASTSEVQLLRLYEPDPGIFLAESPKVIERAMDAGYHPISFLAETKYLEEYEKDISAGTQTHPHAQHIMRVLRRGGDVPVYTAQLALLEQLTGFHLTSGLVSAMRRRQVPSMEEVCRDAKRIVLLEDITNPTNVGAIIRSAAALNMDAILLTRDCADPLYRRAIRVSMGTVFQIPWTIFGKRLTYPDKAMEQIHSLGFKTAAMVLQEDSIRIDDPCLQEEEKLAVVLGAEGDGLKGHTIASCDYRVCIPMSHDVDSLNVAAAGAVAFWQLGKKDAVR